MYGSIFSLQIFLSWRMYNNCKVEYVIIKYTLYMYNLQYVNTLHMHIKHIDEVNLINHIVLKFRYIHINTE